MQQYMKTYKILLETKGPLHIGSGKQMGKKEYIYNEKIKEIIVPDLVTMYKALKKKSLANVYEKEFLLGNEENLYSWLMRKGISYAECKKWAKYVYNCSDTDFSGKRLDKKTKNVSFFMKDAYEKPYVPGSSLKGALRTILCANELMKNEKLKRKCQNIIRNQLESPSKYRNNYLKREIHKIESEVFHVLSFENVAKNNAVCDQMKGMIISDSKPLKISDLILCQKIDVDIRGQRNKFPILKECIKPGREIEFDLTIDCNINRYYDETIMQAINNFQEGYYHFLNKYSSVDKEENILYLGGSAGFVSKTILYGLFPEKEAVRIISTIFDKTLSKNARREHHHERDIRLGVSPHTKKCTQYLGREYEFGKCKIHIEKV